MHGGSEGTELPAVIVPIDVGNSDFKDSSDGSSTSSDTDSTTGYCRGERHRRWKDSAMRSIKRQLKTAARGQRVNTTLGTKKYIEHEILLSFEKFMGEDNCPTTLDNL